MIGLIPIEPEATDKAWEEGWLAGETLAEEFADEILETEGEPDLLERLYVEKVVPALEKSDWFLHILVPEIRRLAGYEDRAGTGEYKDCPEYDPECEIVSKQFGLLIGSFFNGVFSGFMDKTEEILEEAALREGWE
ncbi:MAG: hypothetical protein DRJ03_17005 [Chloroflexi bacterium]|nr:MAG: hypothetical protein DRJ03_17005 [Chloroflexota bacterium]